jgi:heme-degrading monooxygenase HmoA
MHHFRIASYEILDGTPASIADAVSTADGLREIFKKQPGFEAYSVIEVDPKTVVSLSTWESHSEAEDAVSTAANWVADNLADRVKLNTNLVGDALFFEGAAT